MLSSAKFLRGVVVAFVALAPCGCASAPVAAPANLRLGVPARSLPAPVSRGSTAGPQIEAVDLSTTDVRRGSRWSGTIVTSTNVASVEVRTNLFSIDVPRTAFGRFAFAVDVFDLPPIFIRPYRLRVIARNAAGRAAEEDLPLRFR
ncbi:MAG TPA: hypothetical protein VIG51_13540 [Candidatus Baltobacteraceae bacterium]|jgi:hypothetical protein